MEPVLDHTDDSQDEDGWTEPDSRFKVVLSQHRRLLYDQITCSLKVRGGVVATVRRAAKVPIIMLMKRSY